MLCCGCVSHGQTLNDFLESSDTLHKGRRNAAIIAQTGLYAGTLIGLNQLWYADYQKAGFHLKNDNHHWLQMDKAGHIFAGYHLSSIGSELMNWSGVSKKNRLWYAAGTSLLFMTTVEMMDGHSAEWGFSWGDAVSNIVGIGLFVSQELIWGEQRIVPKFSFHTTTYATMRPSVLGNSVSEQILKDYNGQTYWLSANIHSFFKESEIPKWLNVAVGYGAEGMITANDKLVNTIFMPEKYRVRQFYLSLDVDLTKIQTDSHLLKTFFYVFNTVKIPAPTLEIRGNGKIKLHPVYF